MIFGFGKRGARDLVAEQLRGRAKCCSNAALHSSKPDGCNLIARLDIPTGNMPTRSLQLQLHLSTHQHSLRQLLHSVEPEGHLLFLAALRLA